MSPRAATAGFALYLLAGALQAIYGPSLPGVRAAFGIGASTAALLLTAHFGGAVAGILLSGALAGRATEGARVHAATALLALGCLALGLGASWPTALAGAGACGLGYGGLVIGLNGRFATGFGARGPAMVNLLNATFGLGAFLGPLAAGLAVGGPYGRPFLAVGAGALAVLALGLTAREPAPPRPAGPPPSGPAGRSTSAELGLIAPFVLLFFFYAGAETSVGGWAATHLIASGRSPARAATLTALFWGALSLGRLLAAPLSLRVPPARLAIAALAAAAALVTLARAAPAAPAAYLLTGLALAPVFPCAFVWFLDALPGARGSAALALSGACLGGAVCPALVGRLLAAGGPDALPAGALAILVGALAAAASCRRAVRARRRG